MSKRCGGAASRVWVSRTRHSVIAANRDNKDYTKVLLYSYYTTITGRGVLLRCRLLGLKVANLGSLE